MYGKNENSKEGSFASINSSTTISTFDNSRSTSPSMDTSKSSSAVVALKEHNTVKRVTAKKKKLPAGSKHSSKMITNLHPLRYTWVFWHYRRSKRTTKMDWMDCQQAVAEMDSLEDFWRFFVKLQAPSGAKINQDYALFKRGIAPMWEDPANLKGGQWIFVIQKSAERYRDQVDNVWTEIVLALVGAIFSPSIMELVCGLVFSMRISAFTKISVWVKDAAAVKELLVLGHELKRLTNFEDCIIFRRNDDMKVKFIL